jgi:hypothetical protein
MTFSTSTFDIEGIANSSRKLKLIGVGSTKTWRGSVKPATGPPDGAVCADHIVRDDPLRPKALRINVIDGTDCTVV